MLKRELIEFTLKSSLLSHLDYDDDNDDDDDDDDDDNDDLQYVCPFPFLLTPTKEQWPLDRPELQYCQHHCCPYRRRRHHRRRHRRRHRRHRRRHCHHLHHCH